MRDEARLSAFAQAQFGVFSLDQARRFGVSARLVQRRVDFAGWERLHRGVYALPAAPVTYERSAMAALLAVGGRPLITARSAARLWGMTEARPTPVELMVPFGAGTSARHGLVVRRSRTLEPADRAFIGPLDLASPARTLCDLAAAGAGAEELLEVAATAVQRRLLTVDTLARRLASLPNLRSLALLREVLVELGRLGRTDSVFEREVRSCLHADGLRPHPGVYPLVVARQLIAVLDVAFPLERVYVEADGIGWHSLPGAFHADRVRHNEIVAQDWTGVHITRQELRHRPDRFLRQLRQVLDLRRPTNTGARHGR